MFLKRPNAGNAKAARQNKSPVTIEAQRRPAAGRVHAEERTPRVRLDRKGEPRWENRQRADKGKEQERQRQRDVRERREREKKRGMSDRPTAMSRSSPPACALLPPSHALQRRTRTHHCVCQRYTQKMRRNGRRLPSAAVVVHLVRNGTASFSFFSKNDASRIYPPPASVSAPSSLLITTARCFTHGQRSPWRW